MIKGWGALWFVTYFLKVCHENVYNLSIYWHCVNLALLLISLAVCVWWHVRKINLLRSRDCEKILVPLVIFGFNNRLFLKGKKSGVHYKIKAHINLIVHPFYLLSMRSKKVLNSIYKCTSLTRQYVATFSEQKKKMRR